MDRTVLKQAAKNTIQRDRVISSIVAFIMLAVGAGTSGANLPTFRFNFKVNENPAGDVTQSFENILENPEQLLAVIVPIFAAGFAVTIIILAIRILVGSVIGVGGSRYFLKLRKGEATGIAELAGNFKDGNYSNILITNVIGMLKVFLWSLLFIIPGLVKSYELFPMNYILATRPELDRDSVFDLCKRMMNGKKLDLFVLQLSFFGWGILNAFTCGILGIVYLNAYMQATFTEFFITVRDDAIRNGVISSADIPDYGVTQYSSPDDFGGYNGYNGFDPNGGYNPNNGFNPDNGAVNNNPEPFTPYYPNFDAPSTFDENGNPVNPQNGSGT